MEKHNILEVEKRFIAQRLPTRISGHGA